VRGDPVDQTAAVFAHNSDHNVIGPPPHDDWQRLSWLMANHDRDWRGLVQADVFMVVRLRLYTVAEGGQNRVLQSGFRARWQWGPGRGCQEAPLVFADDARRSLRPGEEAIVHVFPLIPDGWDDVGAGTRLGLCTNPPRLLGEGDLLDRSRLPD
jgi:hypothetical protein